MAAGKVPDANRDGVWQVAAAADRQTSLVGARGAILALGFAKWHPTQRLAASRRAITHEPTPEGLRRGS